MRTRKSERDKALSKARARKKSRATRALETYRRHMRRINDDFVLDVDRAMRLPE